MSDAIPQPSSRTEAATPRRATIVYFDGACPLCRREIGMYRGLTPRAPLRWVDVSGEDPELPRGLDREAALARFHVRTPGGELLSGARAFAALWATLPGWRWLAKLAAVPGVTPLLEFAYRAFLRVRPRVQRVACRLEGDGGGARCTDS